MPDKKKQKEICKENLKTKKKKKKKQSHGEDEGVPSTPRRALMSLISCKHRTEATADRSKKTKSRKIGCSGSLCSMKDNQGIIPRPEESSPVEPQKKRLSVTGSNNNDSGCSSRSLKTPLTDNSGILASNSNSSNSCNSLVATCSSSSISGSFRGMHLGRFSGCYECHMVVDPISGVYRVPSLRTTISPCTECGEVFMKPESLEFHQAILHAVSELGPEDTSRNIVEIIFQSSWLKKQSPVCKIDRILKVHNTQKTISRFDDYRDLIKSKANKLSKKYPRCIADGNELLRFHCTGIKCSLGLNGSTNLCDSIPHCRVCSIIRDGFKTDALGKIRTMATSGRAHDTAQVPSDDETRAVLVCRVIAGRVKKSQDASDEGDSVAGTNNVYSDLDELFVFNPKAILPCFVVIYRGF